MLSAASSKGRGVVAGPCWAQCASVEGTEVPSYESTFVLSKVLPEVQYLPSKVLSYFRRRTVHDYTYNVVVVYEGTTHTRRIQYSTRTVHVLYEIISYESTMKVLSKVHVQLSYKYFRTKVLYVVQNSELANKIPSIWKKTQHGTKFIKFSRRCPEMIHPM